MDQDKNKVFEKGYIKNNSKTKKYITILRVTKWTLGIPNVNE